MQKVKQSLEVLVGQQIRALRIDQGLSVEQLAAAIGASLAELEGYENGCSRPSAARLWELAQTLRVPLSVLFNCVIEIGNPQGGGIGPIH
jgi:transcriptional regulator with XRE-family HTH domain